MTESVSPRALDLLREVVGALPESTLPERDTIPVDHAEDASLAAIAVLTEPSVASAALAELAILERLAAASPHLVKDGSPVVETPDVDADGKQLVLGGIKQVTRAHTVHACPDCSRGLYSIEGVLVCIQLSERVGTLDGTEHDIVACGRER